MRRILIALSFLGTGLLTFTGCQEVYDHQVDNMPDYLVVNGLLTTNAGPHEVRLSVTTPYGHQTNRMGISGATVWVEDCTGNEVLLEETSAGRYYTPDSFYGEVGKTYILKIITPDGYIYESDPQEIKPPVEFQDVDAEFSYQTFYFPSSVSNRIYEDLIEGTKVYLETALNHEGIPIFRFEAGLYLQYYVQIPGPQGTETYDYCWLIRDVTDLLPRDIPDFSSGGGFYHHLIGFLPFSTSDLYYFNIPEYAYDHHRTLITRLYTLNSDSHAFHNAKNLQLSDEGKFFDPIAAELPTNMRCVNDTSRRVFGLFEASSETAFSFRVQYVPGSNIVHMIPWEDPNTIPHDGCLYEEKPDFWIE